MTKAKASTAVGALEVRRREQASRLGCFTEREVAELTGYSLGTLYTYRNRGIGLPWVRIGPEVLYPVEPLRKLITDRMQHPKPEGSKLL